MSIRRFLVCFALLSILFDPASSQEPERVNADNGLSMGLVTPHVKWARGYSKGKIRAFFLLQGLRGDKKWIAPNGCGRAVVELAQRFDIEPVVAYTAQNEPLHGRAGEERIIKLLQSEYDVFVTTVPIDILSAKAQYFLLKQVRDGAGLVCFGRVPKEVMTREREMPRPLPAFLAGDAALPILAVWRQRPSTMSVARSLLTCYQLGDGRGVRVRGNFGGNTSFSFEAVAENEYWFLFCGRIFLWAAGKESSLSVVNRATEILSIRRDQLPGRVVGLALRNFGDVRLFVRRMPPSPAPICFDSLRLQQLISPNVPAIRFPCRQR